MGKSRRATVQEARAAVVRLRGAGLTQAEMAARLGLNREGTVSDWLAAAERGETRATNVTLERLHAVVAEATRQSAPPLDVRSYTAGLLVGIEGDLQAGLRRIAEARETLGLPAQVPPSPLQVEAAVRGAAKGRKVQ